MWLNVHMRPTEYKPEYVQKATEYIDSCVDTNEVWIKSESDKGETRERIKNVKLPTHEGFAIYLGVATSSLYAWAKEHEEFSKALEKIKEHQKQKLIDKTLAGEYNSTIAKLILGSNHNMVERQEIKQTNLTAEDLINNLNAAE